MGGESQSRAQEGTDGGAPVVVLFDIDGTLISTGGAGAAAWKLAFDDLYGIPADIGQFSDAGMTDPEVGRRTFEAVIGRGPTPAELARVMTTRLGFLHQTVAESERYTIHPGVVDLLPELVERGYPLGLTTGNVEAAAHIKLHRAGLNRFFCFGGYGSDSEDRTELTRCALERARTVLGTEIERARSIGVGDTPHDVDAGRGAGIKVVGVATGHFGADELREAGADFVVESLEEGLPLDGDV